MVEYKLSGVRPCQIEVHSNGIMVEESDNAFLTFQKLSTESGLEERSIFLDNSTVDGKLNLCRASKDLNGFGGFEAVKSQYPRWYEIKSCSTHFGDVMVDEGI